MSNNK